MTTPYNINTKLPLAAQSPTANEIEPNTTELTMVNTAGDNTKDINSTMVEVVRTYPISSDKHATDEYQTTNIYKRKVPASLALSNISETPQMGQQPIMAGMQPQHKCGCLNIKFTELLMILLGGTLSTQILVSGIILVVIQSWIK
ncbi:uncharacterized protein LOC144442634 [Glandiceps talaboti]